LIMFIASILVIVFAGKNEKPELASNWFQNQLLQLLEC
jgi:hypothetical protein